MSIPNHTLKSLKFVTKKIFTNLHHVQTPALQAMLATLGVTTTGVTPGRASRESSRACPGPVFPLQGDLFEGPGNLLGPPALLHFDGDARSTLDNIPT